MKIKSPCRIVVAVTAIFSVVGCGGLDFLQPQRIEYKSAGKLPPLEIPPDLTAPSRDDRFSVPDIASSSSATLSTYNAERAGASRPASGITEVLPNVGKVRVERSGNQRWLVIPEAPEKVWPTVKDFWQEHGFLVKLEVPEAGVMETDWAENRAKIPQDIIRSALGRLIDQIYSTAERDKFRTRLERAADGSTEIYVSHRGVVETFTSTSKDQTVWQPRASDPELEAEFLRRLMVRFGVEEERAKVQLTNTQVAERAKLINPRDGAGMVVLDEPFDRAWRRVGLALDRVGFTVEDRDRSKGFYFVRYVDPQEDAQDTVKKDTGVLSRLIFWRPSKPDAKAEQYRVLVRNEREASQIQVLNKEGAQDTSETARKILVLLHQQLK
ncbi:MAG: outer membrane protein assembly factor BamC [Burkholderiales bacterium]